MTKKEIKKMESLQKMLVEVLEDPRFLELYESTQEGVICTLREFYNDDFVDEKIMNNHYICPRCGSDIRVLYHLAKWEDREPSEEYCFCENCKYKKGR